MKIVKFSYPYPKFPVQRQTSQNSGVWGNYKFVINDASLKEADYWIVFEDTLLMQEYVKCPIENIIFIAGEGTSTGSYDSLFLKQFNNIVTCQKRININNTHYFHTANPWFVGKSYDEIMATTDIKKTKKISLVCSDKQFTEGHKKRFDFCMRLKEYFGNEIDLFGRGICDFEDKWDVLADYKYSIAIENYVEENWFTEKLYDCFLAHTFPIYYGCPNIEKYFSNSSFQTIDIENFEKTVDTIENILNEPYFYENHIQFLIDAKKKYINEYNIYPLVVEIIEKNNLQRNTKKSNISIHSRSYQQSYKKMSLKSKIKNIIRKIPVIKNIWYYRNLGLQYEQILKSNGSNENNEKYIQYNRCKDWFEVNGDKTLNLTCDFLNHNSVVFDLGGYEGQWSSDIFAKYLCNIFIFEPHKEYANNITQRFAANNKIKVFDFGLAQDTFSAKLSSSDNSSSMFISNTEHFVEIQLVKAIDFLNENKITYIDLIKLNIEGGEYDLLEHLIDTGFIKNIKNIKVQFHDFIIENAKERMNKIQEKLAITHKPIYQYEFVWEHWELK